MTTTSVAVRRIAILLSFCGMLNLAVQSDPVWARGKKTSPSPAKVADDPGCRSCLASAASLFARGKNAEAADLLQQWSGRCPNSSQLHLLLSTIEMRMAHKQEAEAEAAKAAAIAPSSVAANLQYGLALLGNDHHRAAIAQFERVTAIDPSNYEAWSCLGMLYKENREDQKAAEAASKAADLEPGTRATRMNTIANLKRAGKFSEARVELKHLMGSEPSPEVAQDLAREALSIGAFDEAAESAQRVANAYPKATSPLVLLSLAHLCQSNYSACIDDCRKLLELEPTNGEGLSIQAYALAKDNKLEDAQHALASAINATPDTSMVLLSKGSIEALQSKYDEAEQTLNQCLDAEESNARMQGIPHALARATLSEVYSKLGRRSDAQEQARLLASDKRFGRLATGLAR